MRWAVPLTLAAGSDGAAATHTTGMLAPMAMPMPVPMPVPAPTAVRRRTGVARALGATLVVLTASGCGGIGQPAPYDTRGVDGLVIPTPSPDPDDFVTTIDNPWLPLAPGSTWAYDITAGDGGHVGAMDVVVLDELVEVAGLMATAVRTTTRSGTERTRFYAQDDAGNVWWVGEDGDVLDWRAGAAGAEAGLAMPADPRLGDGWRSYVVPGLPGATARVVDQGADMVQTRSQQGTGADTPTLESYTSGVGLVGAEEIGSGRTVVLVDHQPG